MDHFLFSNKARILFSAELLQEIESTVSKPKLKKFFPENPLNEMLDSFEPFVDFISVENHVKICRDPKDDFLLALAKEGKAHYLLTGDKDLLVLEKFGSTTILRMNDFLKMSHH